MSRSSSTRQRCAPPSRQAAQDRAPRVKQAGRSRHSGSPRRTRAVARPLVHAKDPEPVRGADPLERRVEHKPSRQVRGVEERAEFAAAVQRLSRISELCSDDQSLRCVIRTTMLTSVRDPRRKRSAIASHVNCDSNSACPAAAARALRSSSPASNAALSANISALPTSTNSRPADRSIESVAAAARSHDGNRLLQSGHEARAPRRHTICERGQQQVGRRDECGEAFRRQSAGRDHGHLGGNVLHRVHPRPQLEERRRSYPRPRCAAATTPHTRRDATGVRS